MKNKADVICVGAAVIDIPLQPVNKNIFEVESYPLERIAMTIGGDAMNEAVIISRLGYQTALVSKIGDDMAGHTIMEVCKKEGICTKGLKVDKSIDTSINVGLVTEDGERTFVTNRNSSLWKIDIDDISFDGFAEARLLSLASIFNNPLLDCPALVKIFKEAKKHCLTICADMVMPRLGETLADIAEALRYVDYFFPNYEQACLLTAKTDLEEIADCFMAYGVKCVVIKHGKKGCFIKHGNKKAKVPAVPGVKALDTIGAGDNFVSGFITALLDGRPIGECGRFANAAAAISVQHLGATAGVKSREQVEESLNVYKGAAIWQ